MNIELIHQAIRDTVAKECEAIIEEEVELALGRARKRMRERSATIMTRAIDAIKIRTSPNLTMPYETVITINTTI